MVWARFTCNETQESFYVFNVHLSCCATQQEQETGVNLRIGQSDRAKNIITDIAGKSSPVILMGDLNEDEHPLWILEKIGLKSVHEQLGRVPLPTMPATSLPGKICAVDDWILSR